MITSFRHKSLEAFFRTGNQAGIQPIHAKRLRDMLTALNTASSPDDLMLPSWRLHRLTGDRVGFLAMTVQAQWRLVFRFNDRNTELVDYLDYH